MFFLIKDSSELISLKDKLQKLKKDLIIVFFSIQIDVEKLFEVLKESKIPFWGCSSAGEIFMPKEEEENIIFKGSGVLASLDIEKNKFAVELFKRKQGESCLELGKRVGSFGKQKFKKPRFFILGAGLTLDGEEVINGIKEVVGEDVVVYGGLAGDDELYKATIVLTHQGICFDGIAALIFDGDYVEIDGISISGWKPLEEEIEVTKAKGNVVYTLNNKPALDFYINFLEIKEEDFPQIGIEYPLIFNRENGEEVIRTCVSADKKERALIFAGKVPEGIKARIAIFPGKQALQNTINAIKEKAQKNVSPDLLILFSCIARYICFGKMIEEEIRPAVKYFQAPLIGFFTYGEFGKIKNTFDFQNETNTLVWIKVRKNEEF